MDALLLITGLLLFLSAFLTSGSPPRTRQTTIEDVGYQIMKLSRSAKVFLKAFVLSMVRLFRVDVIVRTSQVSLNSIRQHLMTLLFGRGILHA